LIQKLVDIRNDGYKVKQAEATDLFEIVFVIRKLSEYIKTTKLKTQAEAIEILDEYIEESNVLFESISTEKLTIGNVETVFYIRKIKINSYEEFGEINRLFHRNELNMTSEMFLELLRRIWGEVTIPVDYNVLATPKNEGELHMSKSARYGLRLACSSDNDEIIETCKRFLDLEGVEKLGGEFQKKILTIKSLATDTLSVLGKKWNPYNKNDKHCIYGLTINNRKEALLVDEAIRSRKISMPEQMDTAISKLWSNYNILDNILDNLEEGIIHYFRVGPYELHLEVIDVKYKTATELLDKEN
jgi:hypothetical protein